MIEFSEHFGHVDHIGVAGLGPLDLAVHAVEVTTAVGVEVDADRDSLTSSGENRVNIARVLEVTVVPPVSFQEPALLFVGRAISLCHAV